MTFDLKTIQNWFHDLVHNAASSVSDLLEKIKPSVDQPPDVVEIIRKAVAAAELSGATGPEKKESAYSHVTDALKEIGKAVAPYILNFLIEAAVVELKTVTKAK